MKKADCVCRGTTTQAEADFRNAHYELHIAQVQLYPLNGTRLEYCRVIPSDYVLSVGGCSGLPTFNGYFDLSLFTSRQRIATAIRDRINELGVEGVMLDTPFECAPWQTWLAAQLVMDVIAACPGKIVMPNFGDLFTWSDKRPTPNHALAAACQYQFVQVGLDISERYNVGANFSGHLALLISTAKERLDAGYTLVIGIYDPQGLHPADAAQLMQSPQFQHAHCYLYYQTTGFSNILPLKSWQWCSALPE